MGFFDKVKEAGKRMEVGPEHDIRQREDRLVGYFEKYMKQFVFVEFSEGYLKRNGITDIMKGVPIPLRKEDVEQFKSPKGVPNLVLAENISWVIGCNPHFKHTANYVDYLKKIYNHKLWEGMLKKGRDAAERGEMEEACIKFRSTLCFQPDYLHGMYSYARACRELYNNSDDKEYVGRFKAESLEYFEMITLFHPKFAQAYYYLGYAYLNMGLYKKAELTWEFFNKISRNSKDIKEIRSRIEQIREPVKIEEGCNAVLAGRFAEGINILEPFLRTKFNDWWPLYYYLGVAYERTGKRDVAVDLFKNALKLNPSHIETMLELADIYRATGDMEKVNKFEKKAKMLQVEFEGKNKDNKEAESRSQSESGGFNVPGSVLIHKPKRLGKVVDYDTNSISSDISDPETE